VSAGAARGAARGGPGRRGRGRGRGGGRGGRRGRGAADAEETRRRPREAGTPDADDPGSPGAGGGSQGGGDAGDGGSPRAAAAPPSPKRRAGRGRGRSGSAGASGGGAAAPPPLFPGLLEDPEALLGRPPGAICGYGADEEVPHWLAAMRRCLLLHLQVRSAGPAGPRGFAVGTPCPRAA
jgi:hypothetical protein